MYVPEHVIGNDALLSPQPDLYSGLPCVDCTGCVHPEQARELIEEERDGYGQIHWTVRYTHCTRCGADLVYSSEPDWDLFSQQKGIV